MDMYSEELKKETEKEKEERTERWKKLSNATIHVNTEFVVTPGLSVKKRMHTLTHTHQVQRYRVPQTPQP